MLAFGSPNDVGNLFSEDGIRAAGAKMLPKRLPDKDVHFYFSIASADRTPETVKKHAEERPYDVVVAGAGMSNALIGAWTAYTKMAFPEHNPVFLGLPISDKSTGGLSALLSTQEKPPGCPVGCVGVDRLDAAIELAYDLAARKYDKVILVKESLPDNDKTGVFKTETSARVTGDAQLSNAQNAQFEKCKAKLTSLGIQTHSLVESKYVLDDFLINNSLQGWAKNALILFPYETCFYEIDNKTNIISRNDRIRAHHIDNGHHPLALLDVLMSSLTHRFHQHDIVIASSGNIGGQEYSKGITELSRTLNVRFSGAENMALLAARIIANSTGDDELKRKLKEEGESGKQKYNPFRESIEIQTNESLRSLIDKCRQ